MIHVLFLKIRMYPCNFKKITSFTLVWIGYILFKKGKKGTRRQVSIPSAALQQDYWRDLVEQRRQTTGAGQQMVGRRIARRVGGARLILGGASQARRRRLYFLYGRLSFSRLILLFCVYVLYCTHTRGERTCAKVAQGLQHGRASHPSGWSAIKKLNTTFNMSHLFGLKAGAWICHRQALTWSINRCVFFSLDNALLSAAQVQTK